MLPESRIWQALNILAILVNAFPLYAALNRPSKISETRLRSGLSITSDVTSSLSGLGNIATVSIVIDKTPIKNLVLSVDSIKNVGSRAIIPSDFYEPLSINVPKPWKILLVKNTGGEKFPVWKKINDQRFQASPKLLNPGDSITISLYATNTENDHLTVMQAFQLKPTWKAHILNLQAITEQPNPLTVTAGDPFLKFEPFIVYLYGTPFITTIGGSILFMIVYIHLLYYLKIITVARWQSIAAIVGVGILSLASSEAISTYLFPTVLIRMFGVNNLINMPWIVINFVLLAWLFAKAYVRGRNDNENPPLAQVGSEH